MHDGQDPGERSDPAARFALRFVSDGLGAPDLACWERNAAHDGRVLSESFACMAVARADHRIEMLSAAVHESENGRVSRVSPVHRAIRNCTRDEGGPFEVGNQVLISSHRKLLLSKAMVVSVAETAGRDPVRQG